MSQGYASQYKLYLKYAKNFKKMAKKAKNTLQKKYHLQEANRYIKKNS